MQVSSIITISAPDLPSQLNNLHLPPKLLNCRGDISLLEQAPRVGIVGARKYTPYGREVTSQIATDLARAGVVIVSGLALGIDSIAHETCLAASGKTIAVLPSGLDYIYPRTHSHLARKVLEQGGLLVSEYENSYRPFKASFLERNRIIAGLSDILIITEAAFASGSLNTAAYALDLGVQIMAVPGNITSPNSGGTNKLIQNGATPITSSQDVLDILGITEQNKLEYLPENHIEASLLESIKRDFRTISEISSSTKLDIKTIQTHLSMLEIKGVLEPRAGNWILK